MKRIKDLVSKRKKTAIAAAAVFIVIFGLLRHFSASQKASQYQTSEATKGTLVVSVSESGQVLSSNRTSITTQASGTINKVYVKNADLVQAGEKIASINLDTTGQEQQAQGFTAYLSAKNNLALAQALLYSLQSAMFSQWETYTNLAENPTYQNADGSPNTANRTLPQFLTIQDNWLRAESDYKNQQAVISQDESALASAWLSYQKVSSDITAPVSGKIDDLSVAPGMEITGSSTTNGTGSTGSSSRFIASIRSEGNPIISVAVSEVDADKVKAGQKATVTFDAIPGKSFVGKVLGVNTNGEVISGVTTYPAIIQLESPNESILPNMSATANIITKIIKNAVLVPSEAVQTTNGQSFVKVLKNGKVVTAPVEIGESSDTQTQILSGVSEGETVVINNSSSNTASPFSRTRGFGQGKMFFRR